METGQGMHMCTLFLGAGVTACRAEERGGFESVLVSKAGVMVN